MQILDFKKINHSIQYPVCWVKHCSGLSIPDVFWSKSHLQVGYINFEFVLFVA